MQHVSGSGEPLVRIAPMTGEHAAAVLAIYQAGIDEGDATFETAAPGWAAFSAARLPGHRFVALGPAGSLRPGDIGVTPMSLYEQQGHPDVAAAREEAGLGGGRRAGAGDAAGDAGGSSRAAAGGVSWAADVDSEVLGWAAVSPTSSRPAYAGVVEHSVYVHPGARGLRIGRLLLGRLIASTEAAGIWTIQAGIFPENTASVALHLAAGFRVVGRRERMGRQHGRWRDVLLVERRSPLI